MSGNADIVRSFYEAWNRRAFGELGALLSPAVEWLDVGRAEVLRGREAALGMLASLGDSFPRARVELCALHAAGDVVVAEVMYSRTEGGRWPHRPTACDVLELRGGVVVRARCYSDVVRTALDLGADLDTADVPTIGVARVA